MPELRLPGCRSRPLAGYLKSLGLLRVVARQADPEARGRWRGQHFELSSALSRDQLQALLLNDYMPTPLVSPWNGRSGFYAKGNATAVAALQRIEQSDDPRLSAYRDAISAAREVLDRLGIQEKPGENREVKARLIRDLRRRWEDIALDWLDAAVVLVGDRVQALPILGPGGLDGSYDFSSNFMQSLTKVLGLDRRYEDARREWLEAALYDRPASLDQATLAHFFRDDSPVNSPAGDTPALGNPWDLVLAIEGSLVLTAGAARRHGANLEANLVAPFTARATGAGYGTALPGESGRAEVWLPLWRGWASLAEIEILAREARAQVGRRLARTGLDFARAAGELGVARGIAAFERYSILERAGQSSLAVPAGRVEVAPRPAVRTIRSLDGWLARVLGFARGERCPRTVRNAAAGLERAMFDFADRAGPNQACTSLERLGALEAALASSAARAVEAGLRPLTRVPAGPWLEAADDSSPEFAVAAALASLADPSPGLPDFRDYLHGTRVDVRGTRVFDTEGRTRIPRSGDAMPRLGAIHARRHLDASREGAGEADLHFPLGLPTDLAALRAFALGRLDEGRVLRLAAGLSLLDFRSARLASHQRCELAPCPAFDALMLAWQGPPTVALGPSPGWAARLLAGRVHAVLEHAVLRLRLAEVAPLPEAADLAAGAPAGAQLAAALLPRASRASRATIARSLALAAPTENDVTKEKEEIA